MADPKKERDYSFSFSEYEKTISSVYCIDGQDKNKEPTGERVVMIKYIEEFYDAATKTRTPTYKYKSIPLTKLQELYNMPGGDEKEIMSIIEKGTIKVSTIFSPL